MHWQKEDHCEAWSPEKQVQPTNKSREEETHVGTVMHYNQKAEQLKQDPNAVKGLKGQVTKSELYFPE